MRSTLRPHSHTNKSPYIYRKTTNKNDISTNNLLRRIRKICSTRSIILSILVFIILYTTLLTIKGKPTTINNRNIDQNIDLISKITPEFNIINALINIYSTPNSKKEKLSKNETDRLGRVFQNVQNVFAQYWNIIFIFVFSFFHHFSRGL